MSLNQIAVLSHLRDIPASFLISLVDIATRDLRLNVGPVLEEMGIELGSVRRGTMSVAFEQFISVLHRLNQEEFFPGIAFEYGVKRKISEMGLLAYAVRNSATVGLAIGTLFSFDRFTSSDPHRMAIGVDGRVNISLPLASRTFPYRIVLCEESATGFYNIFRELITNPAELSAIEVTFPYPRPHYSSRYKAFFERCQVSFDQPEAVFSFPGSWLQRPIAGADTFLGELCKVHCKPQLSEAAFGDSVAGRLLMLMYTRPEGHGLSLQDAADQLLLTPRRLASDLKNEGTSFREMLVDFRMQRAAEYLSTSQLTVVQIATILGYSQPASFVRAFSKWAGSTPGNFRLQQKNRASLDVYRGLK